MENTTTNRTTTTHSHYEVAISNGSYCTENKTTLDEAIIYAREQKDSINNPHMSEENKQYWAKQTYTVRKVTTIIEEITVV